MDVLVQQCIKLSFRLLDVSEWVTVLKCTAKMCCISRCYLFSFFKCINNVAICWVFISYIYGHNFSYICMNACMHVICMTACILYIVTLNVYTPALNQLRSWPPTVLEFLELLEVIEAIQYYRRC